MKRKPTQTAMTAALASIAFVNAELATRPPQMIAPVGDCLKPIVGDWSRQTCKSPGLRDFMDWCANCHAHYFHRNVRRAAVRRRRKALEALIKAVVATEIKPGQGGVR